MTDKGAIALAREALTILAGNGENVTIDTPYGKGERLDHAIAREALEALDALYEDVFKENEIPRCIKYFENFYDQDQGQGDLNGLYDYERSLHMLMHRARQFYDAFKE